MPTANPITPELMVRISVFGRPVVTIAGMACLYMSQSKNESRSWARIDFGGGTSSIVR